MSNDEEHNEVKVDTYLWSWQTENTQHCRISGWIMRPSDRSPQSSLPASPPRMTEGTRPDQNLEMLVDCFNSSCVMLASGAPGARSTMRRMKEVVVPRAKTALVEERGKNKHKICQLPEGTGDTYSTFKAKTTKSADCISSVLLIWLKKCVHT